MSLSTVFGNTVEFVSRLTPTATSTVEPAAADVGAVNEKGNVSSSGCASGGANVH